MVNRKNMQYYILQYTLDKYGAFKHCEVEKKHSVLTANIIKYLCKKKNALRMYILKLH